MKTGILYGIGVGPGDSELITLKAINILKNVDIVAVPKTSDNSKSVALSIVQNYIDGKDILELVFPMSNDRDILNRSWNKISESIISELNRGRDVAFITLGDPTIYSTFMYIYKKISDLGYKTDIIPGITSFCACSAATGTNLTPKGGSIAVIPSIKDSNELHQILQNFDTVVVMKFYKDFEHIKSILKDMNLNKNTIVVEKCTMDSQKIYTDIDEIQIDTLKYFSTMIISRGEQL